MTEPSKPQKPDAAPEPAGTAQPKPDAPKTSPSETQAERPEEIGGRGGLDPTRYGDWEKNGRCVDF